MEANHSEIKTGSLWRVKFIAFAIHLLFSALIISVFLWITTYYWYPDVLFRLENVWEGLRILIPVDAILGPLMTLIVFAPGKKGLIGDLLIIVTIQILALVYGGTAIYEQRPAAFIFAGDRFEIIPSSKFETANLDSNYFDHEDINYPFIAYALPAQTPEQKIEFIQGNVQYQKMVERYRPMDEFKSVISDKALMVSKLVPANEKSEQRLQAFKARYSEDDALLFVLEGTTSDARILLLEPSTLRHIGYLDLDPWIEYEPFMAK